MNIFKYLKCPNGHRITVTKEAKTAPACKKCHALMSYSRKWHYRFSFEYKDYSKAVSTNKQETKKAGEERLRALERGETEKPVIQEGETFTFENLGEVYKKFSKGEKGFAKNKVFLINVLMREYGDKPLDSFTNLDFELLVSEKRKTSERTAKTYYVLLKHMFSKGKFWGMTKNDFSDLSSQIKFKPPKERIRYLSEEERRELINQCNPRLRPMVILALYTGMRKSEIFHLKWEQIDFKNNLIWFESGETKNEDLTSIPMHPIVKKLLLNRPRRLNVSYIFYNSQGERIKCVREAFNNAVSRSGIEDFHFHDLRHDFATQLVFNNVSIEKVQKLMRHKSIEMTLKYAHVKKQSLVEAVETLPCFDDSEMLKVVNG